MSNFKLIPPLAAVGAGLVSSALPALFWADISNATAIGFLPDRRARPWSDAALFMTPGPAPLPQDVPEDMLLRNAEVQYVCRHAARQSHGRSNRGPRRSFGPLRA